MGNKKSSPFFPVSHHATRMGAIDMKRTMFGSRGGKPSRVRKGKGGDWVLEYRP